MSRRTIAIGDIHGCSDALAALLDAVAPCSVDTIITLGEYIDRGPNSRDVVEQLIAISIRCQLVPLMGNHEEAMLDALQDNGNLKRWIDLGGMDTLRSYGWSPGGPRRALTNCIPDKHREFIAKCLMYYETPTHLFIHAGYVPELLLSEQPALALLWRVTNSSTVRPHQSGKVAIVGHTPQLSGEILDLEFLVCIDTNCVRGGWLTALDVTSGKVWQADGAGQLRTIA